MFSNLQIRTAKSHRRKPSMAARAGVVKQRRVSQVLASAVEVPTLSFMEGLFGDEFPEAFSDGNGAKFKSRKTILDLPPELLACVGDYLNKLDLKRLRLANKYLAMNVDPRFDRVYISPNHANLNCLQNILHHPRFKYQVQELVWDEAQLDEYPDLQSYRNAIQADRSQKRNEVETVLTHGISNYEGMNAEERTLELDDFFEGDRLTEIGRSVLLQYDTNFARRILGQDTWHMSFEESYDIYKRLFREEQDIMKQQLDEVALHQALAGLPNIRRIILTSEVWRPWHLYPVYDTPFYRALPPGFLKPSVWPWLDFNPVATRAKKLYRRKVMSLQVDRLGHEWRGYRIVVAALANMENPRIDELIIDAASEQTGISHQLFSPTNSDFTQTMRMARNVPLKRLSLTINSSGPDMENRHSNDYLRTDSIKRMLAEMTHLEHLHFNPHCCARDTKEEYIGEQCIDWPQLFPTQMLQRLKSLALRDVHISSRDLLDLLSRLENIDHIIFDNVCFGNSDGPDLLFWKDVFDSIKVAFSEMNMCQRRPLFTLIIPFFTRGYVLHRCLLIEEAFNSFLYGNGESPFEFADPPKLGVGWIIDDRDPTYRVKACPADFD